eukprot:TRINITY_DN15867_c0_g1_i3.p1 TRINITY_DN15867_c0_g1~~TRINITY_DN15867_c0_g1_i3.p1  ORF type:complete len:176 (-),score=22.85 TRINITY_DN15867_c0_g1_i3:380-907(-)
MRQQSMDPERQQDLFSNPRMSGNCSYYEPPQLMYSNQAESSYYKETYTMPESVEAYNQMHGSSYPSYSQNSGDEIKSEPMEYLPPSQHNQDQICHPSYIDHDQVEKIKIERKRERNRIAASKCRQRKIERIQQLEEEVKKLTDEKNKFEELAIKLRAEVESLRNQLKDHTERKFE